MLNAIRNLFRREPMPEVDPIPMLLHEIANDAKAREERFQREYPLLVQRFRSLPSERQAALLTEYGITMEDFDRVTGYRMPGI